MLCCHQVLWYLGVLAFLRVAFLAFTTLYKRVLRPPVNLALYGANTGAWAVVTGASFGIGRSYAFELAKRGFNILLISRTKTSLQEVAKEIESKHKVKTEVLAIDFSSHDPAIYTEIKGTLQALKDIAILVNNVGVSYPYPEKFLDTTDELQDQILTINVYALTQMTRTVLPFMLRKKRGAIINLSSYAGVVPAPLLAIYSGSKAYVDHFSISLEYEYKSEGITVQSVTPGLTVSKMSKLTRPSLAKGVCMPEVIARGSLDNLGREIRWSPWWMHALIEYVTDQVLPLRFAMQQLTGINTSTRRRALQKEQREGKDKDKTQ